MLLDFAAYSQNEKNLVTRIRTYNWPKLLKLWRNIKAGNSTGWNSGKALEYMLVRAFDLNAAEVVYPYRNSVLDADEQMDGYVFIKDVGAGFLLECKDWSKSVSFDEVAKLHGRLTYRPAFTYGMFVSKEGYTPSAMNLMYSLHPHNILLWSFGDIDECFKHHKFVKALKYKLQYAMITADLNIAVLDGINI